MGEKKILPIDMIDNIGEKILINLEDNNMIKTSDSKTNKMTKTSNSSTNILKKG